MRYEFCWRNKWLTSDATSIPKMAGSLQAAADELRAMHAKCVALMPESDMSGDFAYLGTDDPAVAKAFGFEEIEDEEDDELGVIPQAVPKRSRKKSSGRVNTGRPGPRPSREKRR
jgi:hypothetical protein